jgi:phage terminase small subunit
MNKFSDFNFNLVTSEKKAHKRQVGKPLLPLDWMTNKNEWNKQQFAFDIANFIESTQSANTFPNMVLIELLGTQIDIYIQCLKQIEQQGLIESYNNGATTGPSIHFTMADKALNRAIQIMKELGVTPSHRVGIVKSTSPEAFEIEEFLAGPF